MNYKSLTVHFLHAILILLAGGWLFLMFTYKVRLEPDSYGYLADAKKLFDPGYVTLRPVMYPAWLRWMGDPGPKLSVLSFLLNSISLLYLVYISGGKRRLFSARNSIVLIYFFLLTAIWSYCATILTEAILPAVEIWIFIFMTRIFFPERKQHPLLTILYSTAICILAITLKPWIMAMVLLASLLLFLASFFLRGFRSHKLSAFIFLTVSALAFFTTLYYNRSKSFESANSVILMISTGNEGDLKERLEHERNLSPDSAAFIRELVSEIELINGKYKGNPWVASGTNELKLLSIADKQQEASIKKAFHLMYFEHWRNALGLAVFALNRYISDLSLGLSCLDIIYGPTLPGVRSFAFPLILITSLLLLLYKITRRDPADPAGVKRVGIKPFRQFLRAHSELAIFAGIILFAAICFALSLTLAGTDLQRVVLPGVLFELFALTYFVLRR
jgi:hypothetical protein